jgi:molybdate transport system regulatory protein
MNTIKGTVVSVNSANGLCEVEVTTPLGSVYAVVLESPEEAEFVKQNKRVKCIFKEMEVLLLREKVSQINLFEGTIKSLEKGCVLSMLVVDCKGQEIRVMLTSRQVDTLGLSQGTKVYMLLSPMHVILEAEDE